jgi:protein tyrosine/serine phosphatase
MGAKEIKKLLEEGALLIDTRSPEAFGGAHRAPVFVHCANGKRAGAVALMHLAVENGWTLQEAFEKARSLGFDYESEPQLKEFFERYIRQYSAGEIGN